MTLTNDTFYEILLKIEPKDFPQVCGLNKNFLKLCKSNLLWETKFLQDNIPLKQHHTIVKDWITTANQDF
jgi:hypothetical protein